MRLVSLTLLCSSLVLAGSVRERDFTFEYQATLKDLPAGAQKVELWIPVPHDDAYQRIVNLHVDTPYPYKISTGDQGITILHLQLDHPKQTNVPVTLTFQATRRERIQPLVDVAAKTGAAPPSDLARWLKPDRLVPIDGQIRTWAQEVVDAAHAHTDLEMARAIYNHVVATVKYDKTGKGWGRGDIYYACDARRGNCTDFHAIFIGYARAMGIPARFAIGFPLPADRGQGQITGIIAGPSFTPRASAGCRWMRPRRPRIPTNASISSARTTRIEWSFRKGATSF